MSIETKVRKQFKKLGLKRIPYLVFDGKWHSFSEWGLSSYGRYAYRLNPHTCKGQIKGVKGGTLAFSWKDQPQDEKPLSATLKGVNRYEYQ